MGLCMLKLYYPKILNINNLKKFFFIQSLNNNPPLPKLSIFCILLMSNFQVNIFYLQKAIYFRKIVNCFSKLCFESIR